MELRGADATVSIDGTELKVKKRQLYYNGVEVTADAAVSVPGGMRHADGDRHGADRTCTTPALTTPVDPAKTIRTTTLRAREAVHADAFDVSITTTGGTATGQITVDALDDAPVLSTLDTTQTTVANGEAALRAP